MRKREDDETTIDADTGDEELSADAEHLHQKLTKLKKELKTCEEEKRKNLDGWQRAQADLMNSRRRAEEELTRRVTQAENAIIERFLPVLDSFALAMQGEQWTHLDDRWKQGIKQVRTQCLRALSELGVEQLDPEGEYFEPALHEAVSQEPVAKKNQDHAIVRVLAQGYRRGDDLIRPAKVIVGVYEKNE